MAPPARPTYNIPGISQQPITSDGRGPSPTFVRFWQEVRAGIIAALSSIQDQVDAIADVQRTQVRQQVQILSQNEQILAQQAQIISTLQGLNSVTGTVNDVQQGADVGSGSISGAASGMATVSGPTWVPVCQVDLVGVVAGDLTIPGTGPTQNDFATVVADGKLKRFSGEYRVVEIVGFVETVVYSTGLFTVTQTDLDPDNPQTATTNNTATEVSTFSMARASVGAVSYRLDYRQSGSGSSAGDVTGYLYVRRANPATTAFVQQSRTLTASTGLTGGGDLSANRSFAIANTAVTAGAYGSASQTVSYTVNAQGQLTAAAQFTLQTANVSELTNLYFTTARARLSISATGAISYNNVTGVISLATNTGWTADTGTASKAAHATYSGTASALYVQAELQGAMDSLLGVTQSVKAIKDALLANNILGA